MIFLSTEQSVLFFCVSEPSTDFVFTRKSVFGSLTQKVDTDNAIRYNKLIYENERDKRI